MAHTAQSDISAEAAMMNLAMGAWVSQTISTITRLNVPDVLEEKGPCTAKDLVYKHGVTANSEFLERALRACASVGVVTEDATGQFGPTALSRVLTTTAPNSLKKLIEAFGATWWRLWGELESIIRTGRPGPQSVFGMSYWEYCQSNPKEMKDFGEAMGSNSRSSLRGILESYDFSGVERIADIAGGFGHVAIALLRKYQGLDAVVTDLPELVLMAQRAAESVEQDVRDRLEFVPGDMFEGVSPANVYILKHIIHDWHDDQCKQILRNCHASMIGDGRVLCVDVVLPPMGDTSEMSGKLFDVDMIAFDMGRERTQKQWQGLYEQSGFEITAITPLNDNFGTSLVEGKRN